MRTIKLLLLFCLISFAAKAQYPFDSLPSIKYKTYGTWKIIDDNKKEKIRHWKKTIPRFFNNKDNLTIQLTSFETKETSIIRIYRNKKQINKFFEPFPIGKDFGMLEDTLYVGDVNGDSLLDLKILCWYGGCGIASENFRVIYLFQKKDTTFTKISFIDKSAYLGSERDFENDGNFEIITKTLNYYKNHNYWTFNIYNYLDGKLVCVNNKYDYPIMIQYLNKENYKITKKISRKKMKDFEMEKPEGIDIRR